MTIEMIHYAVLAVLVVAAILDARSSKIPNWSIYLLLAIFGVKAAVFPDVVDLYVQIGAAAVVFIVGLGGFALGAFGAGAVKLLSATTLFLPVEHGLALAAILFGAAFVFTFLFMFLRGMFGSEDSKWASMRKRIVPLSWPIGTMTAIALFYF